MKISLTIVLLLFFGSAVFAQNKSAPEYITIIDGQIKNIDPKSKDYKPIQPENTFRIRVYKDPEDYNYYWFKKPVIIVVTKSFILSEFYKLALENNPTLKNKIPSSNYLLKLGIISNNTQKTKTNYNQLYEYVYTCNIKQMVKKIDIISYIEPEKSVKLNPKWNLGALKIIDLKE